MPTVQTDIAALDISRVRSQFPSLSQTVAGQPAVFLDGPGGTQVPQRVIDAISGYLKNSNANTCGAYATSQHTNAMIAEARAAMADFFGCDHDEVVFGPNMTSLTFAISRAIGRELGPRDGNCALAGSLPFEIVLEHAGGGPRWILHRRRARSNRMVDAE